MRSQTHASSPAWEAIIDISRSRTGSASAFSSGATCSACSATQRPPPQRRAARGGVDGVQHDQRLRHTSILTFADVCGKLGSRRHRHRSISGGSDDRRVQLALNVNDLEESIAFYSKLFGTEPAKLRPGYANFAIAEPPLKLVLMENPGQGGSLNHLGVEVADTDAVDAEQTRLAGRPGLDRRARHHLLLRQAGQVLGRRSAQRRAVGDLHRV